MNDPQSSNPNRLNYLPSTFPGGKGESYYHDTPVWLSLADLPELEPSTALVKVTAPALDAEPDDFLIEEQFHKLRRKLEKLPRQHTRKELFQKLLAGQSLATKGSRHAAIRHTTAVIAAKHRGASPHFKVIAQLYQPSIEAMQREHPEDFHGMDAVKKLYLSAVEKYAVVQEDAKTIVITSRQFRDLVAPTWTILLAANETVPTLFKRNGELCRIIRSEENTRVEGMSESAVYGHMTQVITWIRKDEEGRPKDAHPPHDLAQNLLAWPHDNLPLIESVVQAPCIDAAGEVLEKPGYHANERIWYEPARPVPSIPTNPARPDALAARDLLLHVIKDFPFEHRMHQSAWLALVLTIVGRRMFEGAAPGFICTANVKKTGKTMLMRLAALISTLREAPINAWPTTPEEQQKTLTTFVREGEQVVLFDNSTGTLSSDALEAMLTSTVWKSRILGKTQSTGSLPNKTVWCFTGNNLRLGGDLACRVIPIKLMSPLERPDQRNDFEDPYLIQTIKEDCAQYFVAAMTILKAYHIDSCGIPPSTPMGGFEGWTTIRDVIQWIDLPDPLDGRNAMMEEDDEDTDALRALLAGIEEVTKDGPKSTVQLLSSVREQNEGPLRDALLEYLPAPNGDLPTVKRFSKHLAASMNRICAGKKLRRVRETHSKVWLWQTVPTNNSDVPF